VSQKVVDGFGSNFWLDRLMGPGQPHITFWTSHWPAAANFGRTLIPFDSTNSDTINYHEDSKDSALSQPPDPLPGYYQLAPAVATSWNCLWLSLVEFQRWKSSSPTQQTHSNSSIAVPFVRIQNKSH